MPFCPALMDNRRQWSVVWVIGVIVAISEVLAVSVAASTRPAAPWVEIRESTACEAMQDEYCLGRYGFRIRSDSAFVAGGSGAGRTIEGRIATGELQQLSLLVREASTGVQDTEERCRKGSVPGVKDQIDLEFADGIVVRIYDLGGQVGQVCHVGSRRSVHRLHEYLQTLMKRYYPLPFPIH